MMSPMSKSPGGEEAVLPPCELTEQEGGRGKK